MSATKTSGPYRWRGAVVPPCCINHDGPHVHGCILPRTGRADRPHKGRCVTDPGQLDHVPDATAEASGAPAVRPESGRPGLAVPRPRKGEPEGVVNVAPMPSVPVDGLPVSAWYVRPARGLRLVLEKRPQPGDVEFGTASFIRCGVLTAASARELAKSLRAYADMLDVRAAARKTAA